MITKKLAKQITGGLSETSKMDCLSYGLPALDTCDIGAILAEKPGTICHDCYACKGFYRVYPSVLEAQWRRFNGTKHELWADSMVKLIDKWQYFRWHDSGDIYSYEYLEKIVEVAKRTPHCQHWLPTREVQKIRRYITENGGFPDNLIVRISGNAYDRLPIGKYQHTSTVHKMAAPIGFKCPARNQGNKCLDCRACWDKSVDNVSYEAH